MSSDEDAPSGGQTRRQVIQRGVAGGIAVAFGELLAPQVAGATAGLAGSAKAFAGALSAADIATIQKTLQNFHPSNAGKGRAWSLGLVESLSGPTAYNGVAAVNGTQLAVEHIQQLGGPDIDFKTIDNQGGTDPTVGVQAILELNDAGIHATLTSVYNALGSMTPGAQRDHILCIDPGAGNSLAPDQPYFWGACSTFPTDFFPGVFKFISQQFPSVKQATIVFPNVGAFFTPAITAAQAGFTALGIASNTVPAPNGATDYSDEIDTVRSQSPALVLNLLAGLDPAYFMKGYAASGITAPVIGVTAYSPDTEAIAGTAWEGMYNAQDDFNASSPGSSWAKIFTRDYITRYGSAPWPYPASYYENTFVLWQLMRDVIASRRNFNNGATLQQALVAGPSFPSVFGGNGTTPGRLIFNTSTHGLTKRPMVISIIKHGVEVPLARFVTGGGSYVKV